MFIEAACEVVISKPYSLINLKLLFSKEVMIDRKYTP